VIAVAQVINKQGVINKNHHAFTKEDEKVGCLQNIFFFNIIVYSFFFIQPTCKGFIIMSWYLYKLF